MNPNPFVRDENLFLPHRNKSRAIVPVHWFMDFYPLLESI